MNIRSCLLGLTACSALFSIASAQPVTYWSTVDPRPDGIWMEAPSAAFNANGDGFLFGARDFYDEQSGDTINPAGGRLTKFSPQGEPLWHVDVPNAEAGYGGRGFRVTPTADGGAVTFVEWDGSEYETLVLTKYSSDGQQQWQKADEFGPAFVVGPDSSVYSAGADSESNTVFVKRVDTQGNETTIASFTLDNAFLSALTLDGNGGVWAAGGQLVSATNSQDLLLVHIDALGNLQKWTYTTYTWFNPEDIERDGNGDLVVGGRAHVASGTQTITVAKFHPDGTQLWQDDFTDGVDPYFLPQIFHLDPSGNLIFAYHRDGVNLPIMYKLDPNGNTLWTTSFNPGDAFQGLVDFLVDPGGNIFACYDTEQTTTTTYNYNYNVVKYLPNGQLGWPSLANGDLVFDGSPDDQPGGIGRDSSGLLYVGGTSSAGGREGQHVIKYGPANNSSFVGQSVPTSMVAGQTYMATLIFSNTGPNAWTMANGYYLRSINPTDNITWARRRVDLSSGDNIVTGQAKTFKFSFYAPMIAGTYNFQWRMAQGSSSFGAVARNVAVTVYVRQHAARYVSQSVPGSVTAGSTFTVSVTMENVGTNTWTQAGGYMLASVNPGLNTTWGVSTVPLSASDSIAHGASKTFTFTCHAPASPGSYTMKWQMRRQSTSFTGFFGDQTSSRTITVTP